MTEYHSDPHGGLPPTIPPPKWIENASCYSPLLLDNVNAVNLLSVSWVDFLKAFLILSTTILSVIINLAFFMILNTKFYCKWLRPQPRYILSALALNDLGTGCFVTMFGIYPSLFECWPFGETFCQIQALLRGSFSQHSSLILIILACERYISSVHPFSYKHMCNKKICLTVILMSWVLSVLFYSGIVLHPTGFHFNTHGLMLCEPYQLSNNALILASCLFYFPTTMVLMYCYGTIFHSSKANPQYRKTLFATLPYLVGGQMAANQTEKFWEEQERSELASRSSAAISLTFIIVVTPWAIQQVITSCTRTTSPASVDFFVSWLAATHTFWSPIIYWMLNEKFQQASHRYLIRQVLCRPLPLDWNFSCESDGDNCSPDAGNNPAVHHPQVHEKMWGEILEKSFSIRDLSDVGDEDSQVFSSTSSSASCPHSQGNHNHHPLPTMISDISERGSGQRVLL
ncbi:hypothetical protein TCAL_00124, partial [Tigriopus californicus]|eukprot:TCALIF_00124-PA protein Name:"Similar to Taar8c Trace amine-associated receptor 8c (Rattus norvegicus)" AED:0.06 eAED:0.07 QI:13/1/0.5/1/0.6/0.83/6/0/456